MKVILVLFVFPTFWQPGIERRIPYETRAECEAALKHVKVGNGRDALIYCVDAEAQK